MTTKFIRRGLVAAIFLAVAPMAVQAADLPPQPSYKAPAYIPPEPAYATWTGFYIGLNGGYAFGKADVSNAVTSFTTDSTDGWLIGVTAGYNYQTGMWVWGLEGDVDYALIKGDATNTVTCGGGSCEVKNTWLGTARGRIGYAGWNNFMPYITGGAAFAGLKVETPTGSSTNTALGWTAGAGLEYAFMSNWSAKLEYLYADLGTSTCEAAVCGLETDVHPKINIVRAGINYRF
jgi:outer membrane immunogenic protein